jgi:hypothetical protein
MLAMSGRFIYGVIDSKGGAGVEGIIPRMIAVGEKEREYILTEISDQ